MTKSDFTIYNSACLNRTEPFRYHADALNLSAVELMNQQNGITDEKYLYRNTLDDKTVTVDYGFTDLNVVWTDTTNERTALSYDNGANVKVASDENNRFYGNVFGASDNFFDSLSIYDGEKDKDVLKQKLTTGDYVVLGIAMNMYTGEPNTSLPFFGDLQAGDKISFYKDGEIYKTCTILAITAVVSLETETTAGPNGSAVIGGDAPYLYLPENVFKQMYEQPTLLSYGFNMESGKSEMSAFLDNLTKNNTTLAYMSTELLEQQMQLTGNIVLLVGGMIAVIFALAGLINFTNMMITNIVTRKHEFATMQSIGMTQRQLHRMIIWEGVYYAIGAGILGCFFSGVLGLTVLRSVINSPSMWFFTMQFTIAPALIVAGSYFIMAVTIPIAALRFFNKGTVVERLRISV
ncbi:MAG: ABC transporter permease [Paludibacter sp.]|nr:ABC transporter permease [Paludibacter sp.]